MSFERYPTYKDSGVEWLGQVPGDWEVTRLKNIASINMGQSPSSDDCTQEEVGLPFLQGNADFGESNPLPRSYCAVANKLAKVNDILFSVRAPVGAINIADQPYGIGRGLCAITPISKCSVRFVFHALQVMKSELFAVATGSTYEAVSTDQVGNATCLAPPLIEQTQIAAFLDRETAKIDGLVAEQRRLMALLKEKRQAVISHAVTRGLNPDAPMKPSGIEWLGDVPAHWEVGPLKRYWSVTDCKHVTAEFVDDGIPLASIREVQSRWVALEDAKCTTEYFYELLIEGGRKPLPGDLIFSRNATVGEVAQVRDEHPRFAMGQDVVLLRKLTSNYSSDYLQRVIRSPVIILQLANMMIGSTFKRINVEEIRSFMIPSPPHTEQAQIASYLEDEVGSFDTLTTEAQHAIDLLQERRTALISAAVTGQIDVRSVVASA